MIKNKTNLQKGKLKSKVIIFGCEFAHGRFSKNFRSKATDIEYLGKISQFSGPANLPN
jgi:hypothetical protein